MTATELKQVKLNTLLEEYGTTEEDLMRQSLFGDDAGVPAICMNENCNATYEYEPDQTRGWCEECQANSVKSALILMGVI